MANRRFEMFEFRHLLVRMRQGDSDRALAKAGLIGRHKARALRALAQQQGWLDLARPLPDDAILAEAFARPSGTVSSSSCVEPFRESVTGWAQAGIQSQTIHQTLVRNHGFGGSYSSVYRFVRSLGLKAPKATTLLSFAPGEAAHGAGADEKARAPRGKGRLR